MSTNTSGGTTTSFFNTPQATDNCYTADEDCVYYFDVMADDLGGNAKVLWSIDGNNLYGTTTTSADGTTTTTSNVDTVIDLTVKDVAGAIEKSALGASISIVDGKVKYDARALDWLADGQTATDYFTYAIRLSNGTLSWATVKITLTGSNDLPTIVSATATGDVTEKAEPAEGGTLSDSGTITFADVDLADTHSATVSASVVDENGNSVASPLGALTLGAIDQTANNVGWTYSVNDSALDFLAQGETRTQVYTIVINDGHAGGNVTQTVTITITGTNDAPVLTVDQTGGVTEDAANPTLTDSGTLSFTDVDVTDTHTVTKSYNGDASWSGGTLTPAQVTALTTGFTVDNDSWDYTLANSAIQFLGAGETITLSFNVTVTDDSGVVASNSDTKVVTLTITGTNDAPALTVDQAGGVTEDIGVVSGNLSDTGLLSFTDADVNDTHVVTKSYNGDAAWSGGTLTAGQITALTTAFTVDNNSWDYTLANAAVQFLGAGETITLSFDVTVTDDSGALNNSDTQTVTLTITGANDAPVLTVDQTGGVTEDAANPNLTDTGALSFTDADLNDTHTVTKTYNGDATWSGGPLAAGQITALTAGFTVDNNSWDYSLANAAVQFLGAGETITLSFNITVTDDSGALNNSDTKVVTLTITGTNDAPVLTVDQTGAVTEDVGVVGGNLTDTGLLSFTDADVNDTHLVTSSYNGDASWSGGTLTAGQIATLTAGFTVDNNSWDYALANAAVQFLGAGEAVTFSFDVTVTDDSGVIANNSDTKTVTLTITGTNDAPVLTGDLAAPINEGSTYQLTTTDLYFTDPDDTAANVTFTVTGLTNGAVYVNGVAGNTFTGAQLSAGVVTFQHDGSETLTASFQVSVEDGNEDLSAPVAQTFSFSVSPVNDPIVNGVPGAQSVNEDNALIFSTANGNPISITDPDAGSGTIRVTLGVAHGTLTLPSVAGLAFIAGTNGSGGFTIESTLSAINAALQGLAYQGSLNYFGPDSLSIATSDLGNSGSGGAQTDIDSVAITVNPVNDAPMASPVTLTAIAEDSGARIITPAELLAGVTDVDGPAATITSLSIASGSGSLTANLDGTWTYTPAPDDDTSVTFNYTAWDGALSASSTATLDITPVNDGPVNSLPAGFSTNQNTPLKLAGLSVTDIDAGAGSISVALTVATGTLTAANAGGVIISGSGTSSITLSGTLAAINAYLAAAANQPTYTPVTGATGLVTLTMTTNDNGNTGAPGALSDTDTSSITINAVNANPITANDVIWASNATAVTLPWDVLLGNDRDPDGIALALQSVVVTTGTLGGAGTVTVNPNGTFSFTTGATGGTVASPTTVTLTYTTIDGAGGSTTGTVTLQVVAVDTGGNNQDTINLNVASVGAYQAAYIDGKAQQDTLTDGGAYSVLIGGIGNDGLNGSAGNDVLRGGDGNDDLNGGAGEDMLDLSDSTGALGTLASPFIFNQSGGTTNAQTGRGNDTHIGMEGVIGTGNNDFITGTGLNDIIRGGGGDDTLNGAGGTADLLDLSDATAGFTINFSQGVGQTITAGGIGTDTYSNFEGVIGSAFADTINGSTGNDFLRGRGGNDVINGGDGNDTITGGLGADTLTGGNGADIFVFDGLNGVDTITDFDPAADLIHLEDFIFSAIGPTLDVGEFVSNSGGIAGDANDYLLYDSDTGSLYYDADGNGAGVRILIATLTGNPAIGPSDFLII